MNPKELFEQIEDAFRECVLVHIRPFFHKEWGRNYPERAFGQSQQKIIDNKELAQIVYDENANMVFIVDGTPLRRARGEDKELIAHVFDELFDSINRSGIGRLYSMKKDGRSNALFHTVRVGVFEGALSSMVPVIKFVAPIAPETYQGLKKSIRIGEIKNLACEIIKGNQQVTLTAEEATLLEDERMHRACRVNRRQNLLRPTFDALG